MEVKELGATNVASELIPGKPDAIAFDAEATHDTSITLLDTYEAIKVVDTPGWSGEGAEAFWERFTPEAQRWHEARLATLHVKRALHDYADAVRTAQRQAEEAIAQWALADFKEMEAAAVSEASQPDPNVTVTATPPPPDPATVSAPYRERAQTILSDAREQLATVAQATADAIAAESGTDEDAPAWLVTAAVAASEHLAEHGAVSVTRTEGQFLEGSVAATELGEQQSTAEENNAPSVRATLAEWDVSVEANLFETSAEGSIELGDVTIDGSVDVTVGAEAGAGITLSTDGLDASAHAGVGVRVDAEGSVTIGAVEASASVEAAVEAEAEATLAVGPDGMRIEGEVFAGASAGGTAEVEVAGVTVGANGELRAGIGAEGSVEFSFDDGRFVIGGEVAAVLGLGGEWGWEVTIDVDEFNESFYEFARGGGIIGIFQEIADGPLR